MGNWREDMAINIDKKRLLLAVPISVVLIGILLSMADFNLPDIALIDPAWIVAVIFSYMVMVIGRGLLMRVLAPAEMRCATVSWMLLAARHQMIFSIFPSGLGDVSFPFLARRYVSLSTGHAVRTMMLVRLRDIITLGTITACGALLMISRGEVAFFIALLGVPVLWFADDIAAIVARILAGFLWRGRVHKWVITFADYEVTTARQRIISAGLSILIWSASIGAVLAAFQAISDPLSLGEALIFIAMVNAAGFVAISIAGLGVSEVGATGALIMAGRSLNVAAATALIVRPVLLLAMLASCLCIDAIIGIVRRQQAGVD